MAADRIERMEQLFRGHGRIARRGEMYVVSIVIDTLHRTSTRLRTTAIKAACPMTPITWMEISTKSRGNRV